jgi:hypothetical protein
MPETARANPLAVLGSRKAGRRLPSGLKAHSAPVVQ